MFLGLLQQYSLARFRWFGIIAGLALIAGAVWAQPKPEAEVKSLWVVNLARFVEWAPDPATEEKPLRIAVVEAKELYAYLKRYDGQTINGSPIQILYFDRFSSQEILKDFNILYVPESAGDDVQKILRFVKSHGVFTISDQPGFIDQGGIMALYIKDGSIRYELNRGVAQREQIHISAELLGRAYRVVTEDAP